jgi:hypothetical protein
MRDRNLARESGRVRNFARNDARFLEFRTGAVRGAGSKALNDLRFFDAPGSVGACFFWERNLRDCNFTGVVGQDS